MWPAGILRCRFCPKNRQLRRIKSIQVSAQDSFLHLIRGFQKHPKVSTYLLKEHRDVQKRHLCIFEKLATLRPAAQPSVVPLQVDEGWWIGECHGRFGLFPANYVEVKEGGRRWHRHAATLTGWTWPPRAAAGHVTPGHVKLPLSLSLSLCVRVCVRLDCPLTVADWGCVLWGGSDTCLPAYSTNACVLWCISLCSGRVVNFTKPWGEFPSHENFSLVKNCLEKVHPRLRRLEGSRPLAYPWIKVCHLTHAPSAVCLNRSSESILVVSLCVQTPEGSLFYIKLLVVTVGDVKFLIIYHIPSTCHLRCSSKKNILPFAILFFLTESMSAIFLHHNIKRMK